MTDLIYAIEVADLSYSGLKILDVKIGKTSSLKSTLSQYSRSHRKVKILDLWIPNDSLTLSECEKGVHKLADKYAYDKEGEKFIFLQEAYKDFSENLKLLLKKTSEDKIKKRRIEKERKDVINNFTGKKPYYVKFKGNTYDVDSWREVLQTVAKQIYEEVGDFSKASTIKGRKRIYFTKNRKSQLFQPFKLKGTPYYYEGNVSANRIMKIINELLILYGYSETELKIGYK